MIIYSFNKYIDILARDNMNFNEYDYNTIPNNDDTNNLATIPGLKNKMCIDQACCSKGTIYDKDLGQCRLPFR